MNERNPKTIAKLPIPVRSESRICFGIDWYATEAEANAASAFVKSKGRTYNGGFYHGRPCGRDNSWDVKDEAGNTLFAVTN